METIHHLTFDKGMSSKEIIRQVVCEYTGFNRYDIHIQSGHEAKQARLILLSMMVKYAKMKGKDLSNEFTWNSLSAISKQKDNISVMLSRDPEFARMHDNIENEIKKIIK